VTVFLFASSGGARACSRRAIWQRALRWAASRFCWISEPLSRDVMNCLILGCSPKAMRDCRISVGKRAGSEYGNLYFFLIQFTGEFTFRSAAFGVYVERSVSPFRFENGDCNRGCVLWRAGRGRHARGLLGKLRRCETARVPEHREITAMFPEFSRGLTGEALWNAAVLTFLVHLGVQW